MGFLFSKIFNLLPGTKETRIAMIGLDNAGKTTILYKLQLADVKETIPTIGFNVETVEYKNVKFQVWDLGGQESLRPYWRSYYPDTDVVIYVIDSSDKERMDTSKEELLMMLEEEELKNAPVVVFANKQDLPNAMSEVQISEHLGLAQIKNRPWSIFKCSAKTGVGLEDAMEWVVQTVNNKNSK